MEMVTQFSIFLVNKPGVLAQVTRKLAQSKTNVIAMTMMDSSEHGVLRLVVEDADHARETLRDLNLPTTETDALLVEMANRPGALADVCGRLAEAHINISYAYCTTGARGGKTLAVFKVADSKKASKVLKGRPNNKRRDEKSRLRRPVSLR
jgi:hypothetical protein